MDVIVSRNQSSTSISHLTIPNSVYNGIQEVNSNVIHLLPIYFYACFVVFFLYKMFSCNTCMMKDIILIYLKQIRFKKGVKNNVVFLDVCLRWFKSYILVCLLYIDIVLIECSASISVFYTEY